MVDSLQGSARVPTSQNDSLLDRDSVEIAYVRSTMIPQLLRDAGSHVMGIIRFSSGHSSLLPPLALDINVPMAQKSEMEFMEVWMSRFPLSLDQTYNLRAAWNGEILLGILEFEESSEDKLEHDVQRSYEQLMTYCETAGYPHLLRMWNYFPAINAEQNGLERYKRFCIGRHDAFANRYPKLPLALPAASAIGTQGGPFQIIFLAGKRAGTHLENPRQVRAYHYPRVYSPKSPSFSRATLGWVSKTERHLYVSGTASIVGHATRHIGDTIKQARETLANIKKMLQAWEWGNGEVLHGKEFDGLVKNLYETRGRL